LQLIELTAECEQLEEGMYVVATAA
jgi:hypothetical protein